MRVVRRSVANAIVKLRALCQKEIDLNVSTTIDKKTETGKNCSKLEKVSAIRITLKIKETKLLD